MSTEFTEPENPPPEPAELPEPARADLRPVTVLIAHDGTEPPASFSEDEARGTWSAVSAPWHPAILHHAGTLPRVEGVDCASPPGPAEIRLVASNQSGRLPSGFMTQAADSGAVVVEGETDRDATFGALAGRLGISLNAPSEDLVPLALDFFALGTTSWWIRDLSAAMGHADCLDHDSLSRETLAGASAWVSGDANTARNRLRAAFEVLTQARERFYPVDSYAVDLCLLDPASPPGALNDAIDARAPFTVLAPARAFETQAARAPESLARLREAITEGWADVVGGAYDEVDEPLLPIESILWQFREGGLVYREHLDGRNVEAVARRRFGLYPMLPQIARRFGFRFGVHLGFDAGRFPVRPEAKRLWESPDHSNLESLTRPPLAADRASSGVRLPWRLAGTMKDDHVATLPLAHWPSPVAGWYLDLRRVSAYSPVLARWVTLNDYFHRTDRPFEIFGPETDAYVTPYLAQAVARSDPKPVSGRAEHARLRARLDALETTRSLAEALGSAPPADTPEVRDLGRLEKALETGDLDAAGSGLDTLEPVWAAALAKGVVGASTGGRPGFLVINPLGVARRATVLLPDAAADLRPEGPLRSAQFTDEGVWAVVDLPAFGFAWVPRDSNPDAAPTPVGRVTVRDKVMRNESMVVEIDAASGGLRSVRTPDEETPRLGQQLAVLGLADEAGKPVSSRMRGTSFEIEYGGPALAQVVTTGEILGAGGRRLAGFRQRFRLWTGRPTLEIEVTLSDFDPTWLASIASADPWSNALACRWAWPDGSSMLRRTCLLFPEITEADRPETPDALDISTRRQRTALLFGGLAHHKRHGTRMLDTLLVAGRESARSFRLGVTLDLEHPFHAAADMTARALVVPTDAGPPKAGPAGWLFQVDSKAVSVTRVEYVESTDEGRGWGLVFHMLETSGHATRCRLRTFRPPSWARQADFQDAVIVDLPVEGDAVLVDFTPHELARIEVTLG